MLMHIGDYTPSSARVRRGRGLPVMRVLSALVLLHAPWSVQAQADSTKGGRTCVAYRGIDVDGRTYPQIAIVASAGGEITDEDTTKQDCADACLAYQPQANYTQCTSALWLPLYPAGAEFPASETGNCYLKDESVEPELMPTLHDADYPYYLDCNFTKIGECAVKSGVEVNGTAYPLPTDITMPDDSNQRLVIEDCVDLCYNHPRCTHATFIPYTAENTTSGQCLLKAIDTAGDPRLGVIPRPAVDPKLSYISWVDCSADKPYIGLIDECTITKNEDIPDRLTPDSESRGVDIPSDPATNFANPATNVTKAECITSCAITERCTHAVHVPTEGWSTEYTEFGNCTLKAVDPDIDPVPHSSLEHLFTAFAYPEQVTLVDCSAIHEFTPPDGDSKNLGAIIAGSVCGGVVLLAVAAVALFLTYRHKQSAQHQGAHETVGPKGSPVHSTTASTAGSAQGFYIPGAVPGVGRITSQPQTPSDYMSLTNDATAQSSETVSSFDGMPRFRALSEVGDSPGVVTWNPQTEGTGGYQPLTISHEEHVACNTSDDLEDALDAMHASGEMLMRRWAILGSVERRVGGQGVVQFVTMISSDDSREEQACKFFLDHKAFAREAALYDRSEIKQQMAAVVHVQDAGAVTQAGYVLPAFIVLEKGQSLNQWVDMAQPDFPTSLQVLTQIVRRLKLLHDENIVHRDLKPANILWRTKRNNWTLIDFGCAADTTKEQEAGLSFSLPYAPPEVIHAYEAQEKTMTMSTALDMWSLGVVVYELLTRKRVFPAGTDRETVFDQLAGRKPLPWEEADWKERTRPLGLLRRPVLSLLSRDASKRPSAGQLLDALNHLFQSATTAHQDVEVQLG